MLHSPPETFKSWQILEKTRCLQTVLHKGQLVTVPSWPSLSVQAEEEEDIVQYTAGPVAQWVHQGLPCTPCTPTEPMHCRSNGPMGPPRIALRPLQPY